MKKLLMNLITFGMVATTLISCGSETKSTTFSDPGTGSIGIIMGNIASQTDTNYPCKQGARLPEVHCAVQVFNTNTVGATGPVQCSTTGPSDVSKVYIGFNVTYHDIMVVSKTSSGQYYVSLGMCPFGQSLTPNRPITALAGFRGPFQITLGDLTTQNSGSILSAPDLYVQVSAYGSYGQNYFGPTTFHQVLVK